MREPIDKTAQQSVSPRAKATRLRYGWTTPSGRILRKDRGSAYVLVMGIALLVTVMGMGALTLSRVANVTTKAGNDWEEAGVLAMSATEQAMSVVNTAAAAAPNTWRAAYTSRVTVMTTPMGRGTMSWALKDETDGLLSEDYLRPFRIYGIGTVGSVTRVYSVQVTPAGTALDLLRTAAHASGAVTVTGNTSAGSGPLSSNSSVSLSGTMNGPIEALSTSGTASGTHPITITSTKTMPQSTLFADLSATATPIAFSSIQSSDIQTCVLSATSNPYGATNANGIYSIALVGKQTLKIQNCRIVGTLLITAGNKSQVQITGPVEWEPGPTREPILVINATQTTLSITGSATWLSESGLNTNFNPVGTPFQGASNTTLTDDYPPQFRGIIHVMGDSANTVNLSGNAYIWGTLIADCPINTSGQVTLVQNPAIYAAPPYGYASGNAMVQVGGTFKWDSLP